MEHNANLLSNPAVEGTVGHFNGTLYPHSFILYLVLLYFFQAL